MVCGFIFAMMVAAGVGAAHFWQRSGLSHLPPAGNGSKVDKSHAATRADYAPAAAFGGTVTSRLRELIQQLGEAIHESVMESEQIAGVVQEIRTQGFDVLLMLEATIGLNDMAAKADEGDEAATGANGEELPFTQNDLHFLRSLRIAVAGDEGSANDEQNTDEPQAD
jgi:uncharacterized protein (UPF0335 family)